MTAIPPAGAFPVGQFPSESLPGLSPSGVFLADAIDPSTGEYRSISRGVDPVEAAAIEALRVQFRSGSAVLDKGNKLHEIETVEEATSALLRAEVEFAWRHLIEARLLEITSVVVESEGDTANMVVRFDNLARGTSDGSVSLPLLQLIGGVQ